MNQKGIDKWVKRSRKKGGEDAKGLEDANIKGKYVFGFHRLLNIRILKPLRNVVEDATPFLSILYLSILVPILFCLLLIHIYLFLLFIFANLAYSIYVDFKREKARWK